MYREIIHNIPLKKSGSLARGTTTREASESPVIAARPDKSWQKQRDAQT